MEPPADTTPRRRSTDLLLPPSSGRHMNTSIPRYGTLRLFPVGDRQILGISNRYEASYHEALKPWISKEDFQREIHQLNRFLSDELPTESLLWWGCALTCCTCGMSFFPLYLRIASFERKIHKYIERLNRKMTSAQRLTWKLIIQDNSYRNTKAWIEIEYPLLSPSQDSSKERNKSTLNHINGEVPYQTSLI
eukprot:gb/GECH01005217.1/.p1 GENE.gb/GECH01005217.1/~~gb/GECH01005217.1/.p1  ORF type:complete len:192 (+),score=36.42 gb/GECH01005217.1/:1-576(+)